METLKAVAVISGGMDSVSYAAIWKNRGYDIYPIIFDYGQKSRKEIEVSLHLCSRLFKPPIIVKVELDKLVTSQLTTEGLKIEESYKPTVVVPLRNVVFLALAAVYAYSLQADKILYGAHLNYCFPSEYLSNLYYAIYPDCTPEFQFALEAALRIANFRNPDDRKLEIWSPAREGLTKAELLRKGYEILGDDIYRTWSCYKDGKKHCGICESCRNRKKAFRDAGIPDKTDYEVIGGV